MAKKYELQIVVSSKDKASGVLSKISGGLRDLGLASLGIRAVKDALSGLTNVMLDAVKGAASFQGISEAFEGIAKSANRAGPDILEAFKKNSAGMISNRDAMLAYNKAAQLVSNDFANTLPDAMGMLAKVASATGQDIGFLTNSLVTGIGRTSPLILDNLGITVDLSEAYETYAKSVGKAVDELTKEEQQAALTAQVMERLAENTAALPDIAGQADTKMAALGATFQDLKDKVGMFLLPAFQSILDVATTVLDGVMNKWDVFSTAIESGMGFWDALRVTFTDMTGLIDFLETAFDNVSNIINTVVIPAFNEIVRVVGEVITKVKEWIDKHPDFVTAILLIGGALLGLNVAVGVLTASVSALKVAFAVLFSPVVLIVGAITALLALLSSGEGGIAGALSRAATAAQQLAAIVGVVLAGAFFFVHGIIQSVGNWVNTQLIPFFARLWENLEILANGLIGKFSDAWTAVQGIVEGVYVWFRDTFGPFFDDLGNRIKTAWDNIVNGIRTALQDIQNNIVQPAIDWFKNTFGPVFETVRPMIEESLGALRTAFETVFGAIMSIIQPVIDIIGAIPGAVQSAADSVQNITSTLGGLGFAGALPTILPGNVNSAASAISGGMGAITGAIPRDAGGMGFPGTTYAIRPAAKTEFFTPDSAGEFTPEDQLGGNQITINFNGTGGPSNQQEADAQGEMLVNSLRAQGVRV